MGLPSVLAAFGRAYMIDHKAVRGWPHAKRHRGRGGCPRPPERAAHERWAAQEEGRNHTTNETQGAWWSARMLSARDVRFVKECHTNLAFGEIRNSLVHVRREAGPACVPSGELNQAQAGRADQIVRFPVQMTAATTIAPQWSKAILPFTDARVGRQPVLDEPKLATCSQDAPHFSQCGTRIWDAA